VTAPELMRLHWTHPVIGEIDEIVCPAHDAEVRNALATLGIGSISSDGSVSVSGVQGPGELATCLRCQAHPAKLPRELLRQWFGGTR
jgi:hypothetical protein